MITLEKGERVSLDKLITKVRMELSWDISSSQPMDLDAVATLLDAEGKATDANAMVFYGMNKVVGKLISACGSTEHSGDNLTGAGDGVDEAITVDLTKVPVNCEQIEFSVNIFKAQERNQNFGQVKRPKVSIVDAGNNLELKSYEPDEDFSTSTGIVLGSLYRKGDGWNFKTIGEGSKDGLVTLRQKYAL